MRHRKHDKILVKLSSIVFGIIVFTATANMQSARAGPDGSYDRHSQCAWVTSSGARALDPSLNALPPEPEEKFLVNEDVNIITGLYTRSYSRQQNGIVDYKTARQIVISEYNEYWNSVVQTKEYPLLYWEDSDRDGEFAMWVDSQGDGSPCDIVPYQLYDKDQSAQSIGFK